MTLPLWCTAAICCVISKAAAPFLLYPHQQHTHTRCTRCSPISLPFPQLLTAPDRTAVWTCCCWERAESAENYHSTRTATMLWYSTTMYCDIIQLYNPAGWWWWWRWEEENEAYDRSYSAADALYEDVPRFHSWTFHSLQSVVVYTFA